MGDTGKTNMCKIALVRVERELKKHMPRGQFSEGCKAVIFLYHTHFSPYDHLIEKCPF